MPAPDAVPVLAAAIGRRWPRCGQGKLFDGLLAVRERCPACDLDLRRHDAGDGAILGVILVLGALWVHAVLWPVVTVPAAIGLMRPVKAALVALQYRHRAAEMGL